MAQPIISVSGLRGVVGESLTPDLAVRYVAAFCTTLPEGSIVVTRDGRATGPMLADAIRAAVIASGRSCLDADVAATPTTGILVRDHSAAGGIQISASHNPPEYNGLKLFSSDGRVIPASAGEDVLAAYQDGASAWVPHSRLGEVKPVVNSVREHLQRVLATVDANRIRDRRFRVVLDANCGAGSVLGTLLLDELGCRTTLLGGDPNGQFAHPPEPLANNLESVAEKASHIGADITFCQDPDADRLAIIDENGRYIGEECTLALCVEHVLNEKQGTGDSGQETGGRGMAAPVIVANCSTSKMCEDIARKHGAAFFRSAVGEANVVDAMLEHRAFFGGEGNGGAIDPRVGWVRDSFVGMALILDMMAANGQSTSGLADALPQYAICKTKVALDRQAAAGALDALEGHFSAATPDRLDGLRLDWPDRWLLVRASNTEPIVRIVAEARLADEAEQLCHEAGIVLVAGCSL